MKVIQVNGIIIDKKIQFKAKRDEWVYDFTFMPYDCFINENYELINEQEIKKCETVVVFDSMGNNSIEVYYIKIFLSMIYFSYRIDIEQKRKNQYFCELHSEYAELIDIVQKGKMQVEEKCLFEDIKFQNYYKKYEGAVTKNWNTRGFSNGNYIEDLHWHIRLGKREMDNDDFESYLSRAYGYDLCDSYDRRYVYKPTIQQIDITDNMRKIAKDINRLINDGSISGNKMKSAMRLYYEVLMIYCNMNLSIITLSTILETLLLGKDEDNQRKKVSVRAGCIVCDGLEKKWKTAIADEVYFFYNYRNAIVHDGKTYLDFEEVELNNIVENIKHIVFEIVKFYYDEKIKNAKKIKELVKKNISSDGLENGFDYISKNAGEVVHFLLPED